MPGSATTAHRKRAITTATAAAAAAAAAGAGAAGAGAAAVVAAAAGTSGPGGGAKACAEKGQRHSRDHMAHNWWLHPPDGDLVEGYDQRLNAAAAEAQHCRGGTEA